MSAEYLSKKLMRQKEQWKGEDRYFYAHWCPACKGLHRFAVEQPFNNGARWIFNGSMTLPTFMPSMNIRIGPWPETNDIQVCHYFLRNGRIEYLNDCTHALKGVAIDLPDIPDQSWYIYGINPNKVINGEK